MCLLPTLDTLFITCGGRLFWLGAGNGTGSSLWLTGFGLDSGILTGSGGWLLMLSGVDLDLTAAVGGSSSGDGDRQRMAETDWKKPFFVMVGPTQVLPIFHSLIFLLNC